MTIKPLIRNAFKPKGACLVELLVGIGLGMLLVLYTNWGTPKEVVPMNSVSAVKEKTDNLKVLADKEDDERTKGVVATHQVTAPAVYESEIQNQKAHSYGAVTSEPIVAESSEQLVYYAEVAFADGLTVAEKLAALRSLQNIDDPMVVDPVMIAMNDPDSDVRIAALEVMNGREYEEVNEVLIAGLEDDDQDVTDKAMGIIADSDSPIILESIEQALMDSDEKIQKTAIVTLEDIDDIRAVDMLIDIGLVNGDEAIRKVIFDSIEFITEQRFGSYEDAKMWWELNREIFEFD